MNKEELYEIIREAEITAFDNWQNCETEVRDNMHTAFLTLHFLSQALSKSLDGKSETLRCPEQGELIKIEEII